MSKSSKEKLDQYLKKYLEFVRERCKTTDYQAANKLKRIDQLAEAVFTARSNYRKGKE